MIAEYLELFGRFLWSKASSLQVLIYILVQGSSSLSIPFYSVNGLYPAASFSRTIRHSSVNMTYAALKAVHPRPSLSVDSVSLSPPENEKMSEERTLRVETERGLRGGWGLPGDRRRRTHIAAHETASAIIFINILVDNYLTERTSASLRGIKLAKPSSFLTPHRPPS